jgi:hypothetical protein
MAISKFMEVNTRANWGERIRVRLQAERLTDNRWQISGTSAQGVTLKEKIIEGNMISSLEAVCFETEWANNHFLKLDEPLDLSRLLEKEELPPAKQPEPVKAAPALSSVPPTGPIIPEIYLG